MKKKLMSCVMAAVLGASILSMGSTAAMADELDGEIKIGISAAITGNFPLAGQRTQQGIDLALKEINESGGVLGKKLVYDIQDDQNTQTTAVNVVTRLLNEDGICAVIGPHTSGNAAATSDLYKNAKIPFLTGGSSPKLEELDNPYFFRIRPSDTINGQVAAKYAVETLGATNIGISYNNNDFGTGGRDVLIAALDEMGVKHTEVGHNPGDKDLTGQLMKLQQANVDCIISWTDDAEVVLTARQLYELGFDVPVIASAGVVMDQVLNLLEPEYVEGWYSVTDFVSTNNDETVTEFVKNFNDEYGINPELYASSYYSAAKVLAAAIEKAGSDDPEAIRQALTETKDMKLPEGVYTADDKGNMVHGCLIAQIKDKVPTMVDYVEVD